MARFRGDPLTPCHLPHGLMDSSSPPRKAWVGKRWGRPVWSQIHVSTAQGSHLSSMFHGRRGILLEFPGNNCSVLARCQVGEALASPSARSCPPASQARDEENHEWAVSQVRTKVEKRHVKDGRVQRRLGMARSFGHGTRSCSPSPRTKSSSSISPQFGLLGSGIISTYSTVTVLYVF